MLGRAVSTGHLVAAGAFQFRITIKLSSTPFSSVPSNSGSARNRFFSRAAEMIAAVCIIGNSVPAGSAFVRSLGVV